MRFFLFESFKGLVAVATAPCCFSEFESEDKVFNLVVLLLFVCVLLYLYVCLFVSVWFCCF